MSRKNKKPREEMIALAYELQNEIMEATNGRRPWKITTNREHTVLRVVWQYGYEKREWYDGPSVNRIIEAFSEKCGINVHETTKDREKHTSVWLTKRENDPKKANEPKKVNKPKKDNDTKKDKKIRKEGESIPSVVTRKYPY